MFIYFFPKDNVPFITFKVLLFACPFPVCFFSISLLALLLLFFNLLCILVLFSKRGA